MLSSLFLHFTSTYRHRTAIVVLSLAHSKCAVSSLSQSSGSFDAALHIASIPPPQMQPSQSCTSLCISVYLCLSLSVSVYLCVYPLL
ncbi:hypothetical protein GQ42DRAFT_22063 [Ramicandelaber brevisporus]|nr:hypothetical protein GQ42DRAFT_22063 [Ramicandelaber brevisporus]